MKLAENPEPIVGGVLYKQELTVLAGGPGVGKSRLQLATSYGLATGAAGWWGQREPINVLTCSERDWRFNSAQLRTLGIQSVPDNWRFFCVPDLSRDKHSLFQSDPTRYITDNILSGFSPQLINIDTLYTFYPPHRSRDVNDYDQNRASLHNLKLWVKNHDSAGWSAHHASKQRADSRYEDPMDRILGSQAILAASSAAMVIERVDPHDNQYICMHLMSHFEPIATPRYFELSRFCEVTAEEVGSFIDVPSKGPTLGKAEQRVYEYLPYENIEYSNLATLLCEALSVKENRLYAILDSIAKKGYATISYTEVTGRKQICKVKPS